MVSGVKFIVKDVNYMSLPLIMKNVFTVGWAMRSVPSMNSIAS
jgi:hypothetical protein